MTVISQLATIRLPLPCAKTGAALGVPNDGFASLVDLRPSREIGGESERPDVPDDDEERDDEAAAVMAAVPHLADAESEGGSAISGADSEIEMPAMPRRLAGAGPLRARAVGLADAAGPSADAATDDMSVQAGAATLGQDSRPAQADSKATLGQAPADPAEIKGDTASVDLEGLAKSPRQNDLPKHMTVANPADGGATLGGAQARGDAVSGAAAGSTILSQAQWTLDGVFDPQAMLTATGTDEAKMPDFADALADMLGEPSIMTGLAGSRVAGKDARTGLPPALRTNHPVPASDIGMRGGAAHLTLDGDEFGRIDIVVQRGDSGMTIVMRAERGESAELMRRNAEILHRELAEGGIGNARLDFSQGGSAGSGAREPGRVRDVEGGRHDPPPSAASPPCAVRNATDRVDLRL